MRLFEQFGASEFVLKAANAALSVAEEDDQSLVRVIFCIICNRLILMKLLLEVVQIANILSHHCRVCSLKFSYIYFSLLSGRIYLNITWSWSTMMRLMPPSRRTLIWKGIVRSPPPPSLAGLKLTAAGRAMIGQKCFLIGHTSTKNGQVL